MVMAGEKVGEKLERIYTVPLRKAYNASRKKRAIRAVDLLRAFVSRHMKTDWVNVRISEPLNAFIWARSIQKPPSRVKIKVVKEEGKLTLASLYEEKPLVKYKPKKKGAKKGEPKKAEAKPEAGTPKAEKKEEKPKAEEAKVEKKADKPSSEAPKAPHAKSGETKK
jgi:large subunit ribosomal protein L31e